MRAALLLLATLAGLPMRAALGQDRAGPPRRPVAIGVITGASLATVAARDYFNLHATPMGGGESSASNLEYYCVND